jgi:benzoate membrane transport protein
MSTEPAPAGAPPHPVVAHGRGHLVQPMVAGVLAAIVGFAGAFPVVLAGYVAIGASPAEAASGLMMVTIASGVLSLALASVTRLPIFIAWSTPGAALLIATGALPGGYATAVGAYLVASALIVLSGLWGAFGRAVSSIPMSLASAMLAGVLLEICLQPAKAVASMPWLALPIVASWLIMFRVARLWATPVALVVTGVVVALTTPIPAEAWVHVVAMPRFIVPHFDLGVAVSVGLPLFLVTMASQNVPGLTVLRVNGYAPKVPPVFVATGAASAVIAFFGAHQVNLAAITAALCAGPEAHPNKAHRWVASATAGVANIVIGLAAGFAVVFASAMPPLIIQTVAGMALFGSLAGALAVAVGNEEERIPAIVTFLVTASGITGTGVKFLGIGPPFWGLLAGGAALALIKARR